MSHLPLSTKGKMLRKVPPPREAKYWNEYIETMPRRDLMQLQWGLLQEQIKYVYERSRFYKKRLDQAGVTPNGIKSIEDFRRKVSITCKDDIRLDVEQSYVWGYALCPITTGALFCSLHRNKRSANTDGSYPGGRGHRW